DVISGGDPLTIRNPGAPCTSVAFSPDGKLLASGGGSYRGDVSEVKLWDANSGKLIRVLGRNTGSLVGVAFSPDGRRVASAGRDKQIKIWDVASGLEALTLHGHADTVWGLSFSSDGHRLVSTSADQTVRIWDATPVENIGQGQARVVLNGH